MKLDHLISLFNPHLPFLENANNGRIVMLRKIPTNGSLYIGESTEMQDR